MFPAVADILLTTRNGDQVTVFSISTRELYVNVKLLHQFSNGTTLGADYARVDTVVNVHPLTYQLFLKSYWRNSIITVLIFAIICHRYCNHQHHHLCPHYHYHHHQCIRSTTSEFTTIFFTITTSLILLPESDYCKLHHMALFGSSPQTLLTI